MYNITESQLESVINARFSKPVYKILKNSKVGVAGLGGLGSHIAISLARCGIGKLVIADFDRVDLSNLNRQYYNLEHIGMKKTEVMIKEILKINPFISVDAHDCIICEENVGEIFGDCHVVIEAFDKAENKAMLVNTLLLMTKATVVASSGMAGFYSGNDIKTRRISERFYLCGDEVNGIENGIGLTSPRVMICAGHSALCAVRIILGERN